MTENEAIKELKEDCNELGKAIPCDTGWGVAINAAYSIAIKALEEIQQYRAIGTIEEFQKLKALFGNENLEISENATKILKEYPEYLCIGTIEEFKALKEKSVAKKPSFEGDGYYNGQLVYDTWICPCCEKSYEVDYEEYEHCPSCGQKIDWSDEE